MCHGNRGSPEGWRGIRGGGGVPVTVGPRDGGCPGDGGFQGAVQSPGCGVPVMGRVPALRSRP